MVRVAINGFGRIGRLAFRQMFDAEGYQVVAINDLTSPKMLAHLLKYDTAQGSYKYKDTVSSKEPIFEEDGKTVKVPGSITVNGKEITIYAKPKANELPWGELDVDVVLECTGLHQQGQGDGSYRSWRQEGRHLCSGGQRSADHRVLCQRKRADQGR